MMNIRIIPRIRMMNRIILRIRMNMRIILRIRKVNIRIILRI